MKSSASAARRSAVVTASTRSASHCTTPHTHANTVSQPNVSQQAVSQRQRRSAASQDVKPATAKTMRDSRTTPSAVASAAHVYITPAATNNAMSHKKPPKGADSSETRPLKKRLVRSSSSDFTVPNENATPSNEINILVDNLAPTEKVDRVMDAIPRTKRSLHVARSNTQELMQLRQQQRLSPQPPSTKRHCRAPPASVASVPTLASEDPGSSVRMVPSMSVQSSFMDHRHSVVDVNKPAVRVLDAAVLECVNHCEFVYPTARDLIAANEPHLSSSSASSSPVMTRRRAKEQAKQEKENLVVHDQNNIVHAVRMTRSKGKVLALAQRQQPDRLYQPKESITTPSIPVWLTAEMALIPVAPFSQRLFSEYDNDRLVWESALKRELAFMPDPALMENHQELAPQMRAILINWLSEVCVEFTLHREVLYLAVNYFDRFLSLYHAPIASQQLQLLGVTALYIAAKVEEVYPPHMKNFVAVCDGACSASDLKRIEMLMMQTLKWDLAVTTHQFWVQFYFQNAAKLAPHEFANHSFSSGGRASLIHCEPRYKPSRFVSAMSVLDVALHDMESLHYRPSVLAASAFALQLGSRRLSAKIVSECTGYSLDQLHLCIEYLRLFAELPQDMEIPSHLYEKVHESDYHNIQLHNRALLPSLQCLYSAEVTLS